LSHNGREKQAVEQIARKLRAQGLEPWLDVWHLVPGKRFQAGLAEGLGASLACAVFLGPNNFGDWQTEELDVAQNFAAKNPSFRLMLVLLPGLPDRFEYDKLPPFLAMRTWVDFRKGLDDASAWHRLVCGIKGLPPGSSDPSTRPQLSDDAIEPYRGLNVFDEEHAKYFFGREAEVQRLVEKLKDANFLAVLGPSGSGKSSLIRAGLIPALREGSLNNSDRWLIRVLRPTGAPLAELAAELSRTLNKWAVSAYVEAMQKSEQALYQESLGALTHEKQKLVWVIDQFEEVFSLCADENERAQFIGNLIYPSTVREARALVLFTMRADFYFKCASVPALATRMASNQFLVSPMSIESLKLAIERPAQLAGFALQPGLTEAILNDVAKQPGALPLLEYALAELWEQRDSAYANPQGVSQNRWRSRRTRQAG
jgi:energy-coupling factor transporter ATP-binding protein EcfA2